MPGSVPVDRDDDIGNRETADQTPNRSADRRLLPVGDDQRQDDDQDQEFDADLGVVRKPVFLGIRVMQRVNET